MPRGPKPAKDTQTTPKEGVAPDKKDAPNALERWKTEIRLAGKHFETWQQRGDKVVRRYRDERDAVDEGKRKFNLLWSNVQTLSPALYSRTPKVQVSRRFNDADKVGRVASQILERAVEYELEKYDIAALMKPAVQDRLLPGWGIGWVRYEPHFQTVNPAFPLKRAEDFAAGQGVELSDDTEYYDGYGKPYEGKVEEREGVPHGFGEPYQEKTWECTPTDYVFWKDFLCSPARTWEEVRWVARRTFPSRAQLCKRFGDKIGNDIPLSAKAQGFDEKDAAGKELSRGEVWEIWDRESHKVYWVATSYDKFADERDDPLGLESFFPCPKPLLATTTTDTFVPVPDYVEYQDQAKELDELTERIALLAKALKVAGVYDKSNPELQRLVNEGSENVMIAVDSWAAFAEKGGLKGSVDFLPIEQVMEVMTGLYNARQQVKGDCYEITGMADIVRGASNPNETATAQQIKGRYANLRLSDLQADVEQFARGIIRIKAEVMAENYAAETLVQISGILNTPEFAQPPKELTQPPQVPPPPPGSPPEAAQQAQMMAQQQQQQALAKWQQDNQQLIAQAIALLKSQQYRDLRIDIETASMIQMDEQGEKESRTEFLTAVSGFLQQAGAILQVAPQAAELLAELLRFTVHGFPVGREMEGTIDRFIEAMAGAGAPGNPKAAQQAQAQQEQMQKAKEGLMAQQSQVQGDQMGVEKDRMGVANERLKVEGAQKLLPLQQQLAEAELENTRLRAIGDIKDLLDQHEDTVRGLVDSAKPAAETIEDATPPVDNIGPQVMASHQELMGHIANLVQTLAAPRRLVRDPQGTVTGSEMLQ